MPTTPTSGIGIGIDEDRLPILSAAYEFPCDVSMISRTRESAAARGHYACIWRAGSDRYESKLLHGLTLPEHTRACRQLEKDGFWPVSVTAAEVGGKGLQLASVWWRTRLPLRARRTLWRRKSRAAAALLRMGHVPEPLHHLATETDPDQRSYLIAAMGQAGCDPNALTDRLSHDDLATRWFALLLLGEQDVGRLPPTFRNRVRDRVAKLYREDPDAGIHSAAEWCLRRWGATQLLSEEFDRLTTGNPLAEHQWYHNANGDTLTVIDLADPSQTFLMGAPYKEKPERYYERLHTVRIGRRFAIATKEVTCSQFSRFLEANPQLAHPRSSTRALAPQNRVTWYLAARYCNWLSAAEGIPAEQWCYEIDSQDGSDRDVRLAADYLTRTGYRLPSEAEWEYACRAGEQTKRYFGDDDGQLADYAYFETNALGAPHEVGQLKPNRLGMFDMLGNLSEWCQDRYWLDAEPKKSFINDDQEDPRQEIRIDDFRITRGGSYLSAASEIRAAARSRDDPGLRLPRFGFRVARTLEAPAQHFESSP